MVLLITLHLKLLELLKIFCFLVFVALNLC